MKRTYDPRDEVIKSLSATASEYLDFMSPAAIGKKELERLQKDSVRVASSAKAAIDSLESMTGFKPPSSAAAAIGILERATASAFEPPSLSNGYEQVLAETSRTARGLREAQDEATRALSGAGAAIDALESVAGFNLASLAGASATQEQLTASAFSQMKEWEKLLDSTNLYNPDFLSNELTRTIEQMAMRQTEGHVTSITKIAQDAFSALPQSYLSRSFIENLPSLSIASMLGEHVRQMGSVHYAQELLEAVGHVDLSAIREAVLVAAERVTEQFERNIVSFEDIHEAIARASKQPIEQVVESQISKAAGPLAKYPRRIRRVLTRFMYALLVEGIVTLIVSMLPQVWEQMAQSSTPNENTQVIAPTAQPLPSTTKEPVLLVVKPEVLNLRAGPSTTQRIVTTVRQGQYLRILSRKREWVRVAYADPQGQGVMCIGWVKLRFTSPMEEDTAKILRKVLMAMTFDERNVE